MKSFPLLFINLHRTKNYDCDFSLIHISMNANIIKKKKISLNKSTTSDVIEGQIRSPFYLKIYFSLNIFLFKSNRIKPLFEC